MMGKRFVSELDDKIRVSRDKHFDVKVEETDEFWKLYPDEVELSITTNGMQWNTISLNKREAKMVVEKLVNHFKLNKIVILKQI